MMILRRLTHENIDSLTGKTICCAEWSSAYLAELCGKYNVLNSISCIVDTNQRNLGRILFLSLIHI